MKPSPKNIKSMERTARMIKAFTGNTTTHYYLKHLVSICAIILILSIMFYSAFNDYSICASSPLRFNDDARQQIPPMYRFEDPTVFADDYITDYFIDTQLPLGYKLLYRLSASFTSPKAFSKILPAALFLLFLIGTGMASYKVGGYLPAFCTLALCIGANYFMSRMAGGLPRAFGFPIIAISVAAIAHGKQWCAAAAVWAGAAFYPPSGVISGCFLASSRLNIWLTENDRPSLSTLKPHVVSLAIAALIAFLLITPQLFGSGKYGGMIRRSEMSEYPEVGPGGRNRSGKGLYAPYPTYFQAFYDQFTNGVICKAGKNSNPWVARFHPSHSETAKAALDLVLLICLAGWTAIFRIDKRSRIWLYFLCTSFLLYLVSRLSAPYFYLPERYLSYTLPLIGAIMIPNAVRGFTMHFPAHPPGLNLRLIAINSIWCILLIIHIGSKGALCRGFKKVGSHETKLYEYISTLPKESVVAGWPKGMIESVPYLTRRTAFITGETHHTFHKYYVLEMRKRMIALVNAYFADSTQPYITLYRDFGVTHLIVDTRHYEEPFPKYYFPFNHYIVATENQYYHLK